MNVLLALALACLIGIVAVHARPHGQAGGGNATLNHTFAVAFANWDIYSRNYFVSDLPIDYIPEIDYSVFKLNETAPGSKLYEFVSTDAYADFEAVFPDNANMPVHGSVGSLMALKKAGKEFNLKMTLGGYTLSNNFSPAVATAASRKTLVASIVGFFNKYPVFNGLVLDWEYVSNDGVNYGAPGNIVSPHDSDNLVLFLQELRAALAADKKADYELAVRTTAVPNKAKYDVKAVAAVVDVLQIITYDFASSSWGDVLTTHQANLFPTSYATLSAAGAVEFYLGLGVPASKLMIGVAMYSRGFANTAGLGKSGSGVVSINSGAPGVADYKILPPAGFVEKWDDQAQATYAYSASLKEFLSYDSVRSVEAKWAYVRAQGLRGIFAWEASSDTPITNTTRSLIYALHQGLTANSTVVSTGKSTVNATQAAPIKSAHNATSAAVAAAPAPPVAHPANSTSAPSSTPAPPPSSSSSSDNDSAQVVKIPLKPIM